MSLITLPPHSQVVLQHLIAASELDSPSPRKPLADPLAKSPLPARKTQKSPLPSASAKKAPGRKAARSPSPGGGATPKKVLFGILFDRSGVLFDHRALGIALL